MWKKIYLKKKEVFEPGVVIKTSTVLRTGTGVGDWREQVSESRAVTVDRGGFSGGEQSDMLGVPPEVVLQLCFASQVEAELLPSSFHSSATNPFTHTAHIKHRDITKDMPNSNFCLLNAHHKLLYNIL